MKNNVIFNIGYVILMKYFVFYLSIKNITIVFIVNKTLIIYFHDFKIQNV